MSVICGRDGRPLVTTRQAAYAMGWSTGAFRRWASRQGIRARVYRSTGGRGRPEALWDLADITDAVVSGQTG